MGVSTLGLGVHSSAAIGDSPPLTTAHGGSDQLRLADPRGRMSPTRCPLRRLPCLRPERPPSATALPAIPFLCKTQEAYFQQKMFLSKEPAHVPGEAQPGRAPCRLGQAGPRWGRRHLAGGRHVSGGPGLLQVPHTDRPERAIFFKTRTGQERHLPNAPLHPEKGSPPPPLSSRRQRSC